MASPPADSTFHPLDPGRVNVMDPVELKYWCEQLRCNEPQLREALTRVGDHVTQVRAFLAQPQNPR